MPDLTAFADEHVRERVLRLPPRAVRELLTDCGIQDKLLSESVERLVHALADETRMDWVRVSGETRLRDLLFVGKEVVPPSLYKSWRRSRFGDYMECFPYSIMHVVETLSAKSKWRSAWAALPEPPKNEEEWLNLIMAMTWCEFLRFFGELVE